MKYQFRVYYTKCNSYTDWVTITVKLCDTLTEAIKYYTDSKMGIRIERKINNENNITA